MVEQNLTGSNYHIPVLIDDILNIANPVHGKWLDGTIGAGGYTTALLEAGASHVIGIDRDPSVFKILIDLQEKFKNRLTLVQDVFSNLEDHGEALQGVVLDLGVSSMQLDQNARGFSFQGDGPLDMRMSQAGKTGADLVNRLSEKELADLLFYYGEERASRRIAKAIVSRRQIAEFKYTRDLVDVIQSVLPRAKPGQIHPATRCFQALRIMVNNEFEELFKGLHAAQNVLAAGGLLIVVTFHSIEDRIVKRFLQFRSGKLSRANRFAPQCEVPAPTFEILTKKAVLANAMELEANPRARSAKLRVARRTTSTAPAQLTRKALRMPVIGPASRA